MLKHEVDVIEEHSHFVNTENRFDVETGLQTSHKYHLQPEFDHLIYVKTNIGAMLDNRLKRARTLLPDVVAIGGTCDAYQPAENKYKNTRADHKTG